MNEYFISFYGCVSYKTDRNVPLERTNCCSGVTPPSPLPAEEGTGEGGWNDVFQPKFYHAPDSADYEKVECRCSECPNPCGQKKLLYRCHLGNLTKKEFEYFKNEISPSSAFAPNTNIESPDYALHSLDDISLDSLKEREDHIEARKTFERLPGWNFQKQITKVMGRLQCLAERIRELRQESPPTPSAAGIRKINLFYRIEKEILKEVFRDKIKVVRQKMAKLEAILAKLESRKSRLKAELKESLQDLQEYEVPTGSGLDTTTEQTSIFELPDEAKGRWVELDDYLNHKINAARPKGGRKRLQHNRSTITWSPENPVIGRDTDGNIMKRTGDNQYNYRYRYFLLHENDLTIVTR